MSPDRRRPPKRNAGRVQSDGTSIRLRPSPSDAHRVVYFKRRFEDDPKESIPGREFLRDICPVKVRALMLAVLVQVAAAPPSRFAGGGYWEAMHGEMTGWYEVRVDGPRRKQHFRLFCRLDYDAEGWKQPLLVVVTGLVKSVGTVLSDADYAGVRSLGMNTSPDLSARLLSSQASAGVSPRGAEVTSEAWAGSGGEARRLR